MTNLEVIEPSSARNGRIAIKSSMPDFDRALGYLMLLYLAMERPHSLAPTVETDRGELEFSAEVANRVTEFLLQNSLSSRIDELANSYDDCPILTAQIEPLQVAFDIFVPLVSFEFADASLGNGSERTGGKRYAKKIRFSSNMARFVSPYLFEPAEFCEFLVILACRGFSKTGEKFREHISDVCFDISSTTIYRLQRTDGAEEIFNTLGLYRAVLDRGEVDLSGKEAKGPLRVLKSAIHSGLMPGLTSSKTVVRLNSDGNREELERLVRESRLTQELRYVTRPEYRRNASSESVREGSISDVEETFDFVPRGPLNTIVYGVPGAGKSALIKSKYIHDDAYSERVVFHPDYLYSSFIGQVLPQTIDNDVYYDFVPGPFTIVLEHAIRNPSQQHVLVIEEINRGNAAAIFGDVFQLLDRDRDGFSEYEIHNPDIAKRIYGDPKHGIKLPPNLQLVATMNTSDQNVFALDTAFQRRWAMKNVPNDIAASSIADSFVLDTEVTWKQFATAVNNAIMENGGGLSSLEDKRLGAYFVRPSEISADHLPESAEWFAEKVLKYLWDDAFKFDRDRIFKNSEVVTLEDIISRFCNANGWERISNVFSETFVAMLNAVAE